MEKERMAQGPEKIQQPTSNKPKRSGFGPSALAVFANKTWKVQDLLGSEDPDNLVKDKSHSAMRWLLFQAEIKVVTLQPLADVNALIFWNSNC